MEVSYLKKTIDMGTVEIKYEKENCKIKVKSKNQALFLKMEEPGKLLSLFQILSSKRLSRTFLICIGFADEIKIHEKKICFL